jgi:hypothetical protein
LADDELVPRKPLEAPDALAARREHVSDLLLQAPTTNPLRRPISSPLARQAHRQGEGHTRALRCRAPPPREAGDRIARTASATAHTTRADVWNATTARPSASRCSRSTAVTATARIAGFSLPCAPPVRPTRPRSFPGERSRAGR